MRRYVALLLSVSICLIGCDTHGSFTQLNHQLTIGEHEIAVYVADSDSERSTGLGDTTLEANQGMVFIWPVADQQTFWMKDVEYPIDIVWVHHGEVVGSVTAQPEDTHALLSQYQLYPSPEPVDMVVELPAGTVAAAEITVGESVLLTDQ